MIEKVLTGACNDSLKGNSLPNTLIGGPGNDTYRFDGALVNGTDVIVDGRNGGNDTVDFSESTAAINLSLTTMGLRVVVPGKLSLQLQNGLVENIIGGEGNDTL